MTKRRKRTKKEFVDYNDYTDRPFGLKWGTAFAIDELNKVITENKDKEQNTTSELPQMDRNEIDKVLQFAFLKSKTISIQLNIKDEFGNCGDNLIGVFKGYADSSHLYINDKPIKWDLVRNISIHNETE